MRKNIRALKQHLFFMGTCLPIFYGIIMSSFIPGAVVAQEGDSSQGFQPKGDTTEEVIRFHKELLSLYMENYRLINNLKSLRANDAETEVERNVSTIRKKSNNVLSKLKDYAETARSSGVRDSMLHSMKKLLTLYELYIEKIISDWKPSKEQVLKRRRMSARQIVRQNPELATPSSLRRAFLGELISSAQSIPELMDWFDKRIQKVNKWVRNKHNSLYPLFVDLLSRVDRVINSDDVDEEERKRVMEEVHGEWRAYWRGIGDGTKWEKMRHLTNQLRSLFRNRNNRLPGNQEYLSERVQGLQSKIGDLQELNIQKPFRDRKKRLTALLRFSKVFVKRAKRIGDSSASNALSGIVSAFISDFMEREPEQYWRVESEEDLEKKKEKLFTDVQRMVRGLREMNYRSVPEQYDFPVDAVLQMAGRLEMNYGKQEREIAKTVRDIAQYVRAQHQLTIEGGSLIQTFYNALQDQEFERSQDFVQFEKSFRAEHQAKLQQMKIHVKRIRDLREELDGMTERIKKINPEDLATAYVKSENNESK